MQRSYLICIIIYTTTGIVRVRARERIWVFVREWVRASVRVWARACRNIVREL